MVCEVIVCNVGEMCDVHTGSVVNAGPGTPKMFQTQYRYNLTMWHKCTQKDIIQVK